MSEFFDPTDKKNKIILSYFESKTWLIVDSSSTTRASIRKSLSQVGAKMASMLDADNISDALKVLETKKPHYVVGNNLVKDGSVIQLFEAHMKFLPNRLNAGFFILAEPGAIETVSRLLEYDMDGIIALPFTGATVIDSVLLSVKHKITPTPYVSKIEEGRTNLTNENIDKATECFKLAMTLNKTSCEGAYYLGQICYKNGLKEEAIAYFRESIGYNSGCFKSLTRLSAIFNSQNDFKNAYEIALLMAQKYPIPLDKIPELVRLSIMNKKYEDINNYLTIYQNGQIPDAQNQAALAALAAGLAILGRHFISINEPDKGIDALKIAFKFCVGKYEILKKIVQAFIDCNQADVLLAMFEDTDMDQWSSNSQGLYVHTVHMTSSDDHKVIMMGEQFLKKKIKDPLIYRALIERGIKLNRKMAVIESLVLEASKDFPEESVEFEKLLSKAKAA